jgi:hypothetical protein
MPISQQKIVDDLIKEGQKLWKSPRRQVDFETGVEEAESLLNDIEQHPHIFVLACVMDRQIPARKAWIIPFEVGTEVGGFELRDFTKLSPKRLQKIFADKRLHRFNTKMAKHFYEVVQWIHTQYGDDVSRIWANNPESASVIRRFLEFKGVGIKIASMAANILARDFKIPMRNYSSIDISPDRQVKKYFIHHGLIRKDARNEELIFLARELYPKFPGILDVGAWRGGRDLKKRIKP